MVTFYIGALALILVVCTGGSLRRLADVRIRQSWLLWAALVDQIIIIVVVPDGARAVLAVAHILSYVLAGACLWFNRRLAGSWLLALGGACNGLAITVNGGTLPASPSALRAANREVDTGQFHNSAPLADPHLPMLGDVFAFPSWLLEHTIFSVGDVLIWTGIFWFLWRTCRPGRAGDRSPRRWSRSSGHRDPAGRAGSR